MLYVSLVIIFKKKDSIIPDLPPNEGYVNGVWKITRVTWKQK